MEPQAQPPFIETLRQLEIRMEMMRRLGLAESQIFKHKKPQPCTIGDVMQSLSEYSMSTAIDPQLASIYAPAYDDVSNKKPQSYSFILVPPSEGEDSICSQEAPFQPSFSWLAKRLTDSSLIKVDQPDPIKYSDFVPPDWKGVREILLSQLAPGIEFQHDTETITNYIKKRFSSYPWVKIKKVRQIYYRGKPAIMVRFVDQPSTIFSYFNFKKNPVGLKSFFGQDLQTSRCLQNLMRGQPKNWVAVMFRRLPKAMSRQALLSLLKKEQFNVTWIEEPVQISDMRYTLVGLPFINDAFRMCQHFRTHPLQCKVNLHPSSCKIYRQQAEQQ